MQRYLVYNKQNIFASKKHLANTFMALCTTLCSFFLILYVHFYGVLTPLSGQPRGYVIHILYNGYIPEGKAARLMKNLKY